MNLKQALAEIEGTFGAPDKSNPPGTTTIITSGGVKADARAPEIALYISREAAISAWSLEVEHFLDSKPFRSYQFVGEIHVDQWFMTAQGKDEMHRVAEPRFVVVATISVEWVTTEMRWRHRGTCSNQNVLSPNPDINAEDCPTCGGVEIKVAEDSATLAN